MVHETPAAVGLDGVSRVTDVGSMGRFADRNLEDCEEYRFIYEFETGAIRYRVSVNPGYVEEDKGRAKLTEQESNA